jgi:ligand-binding sensor domain-containing protein/signal transduction histidine kinase
MIPDTVPFALLLLALSLAVALPARALSDSKPLREYGRQSWQSDSGLPQNTVHAILQSRDGFLWIATEGGLVRFDGQEFRIFDTTNTPELHFNTINDLAQDASGILWISTADGLLTLDPTTLRFTRYTTAEGLPSNLVRAVIQRSRGGLLILTAAGAAIASPGSSRIQPLPELTADLTPALVTEDVRGTLWIASGAQLLALDPDAITPRLSDPLPTDIGSIQVIASTLGGGLFLGGQNGLAVLNGHQRILTFKPHPSASITALLPEEDLNGHRTGDMWIGTGSGLALLSARTGRITPVPAAEPPRGPSGRTAAPDARAVTSGRVLNLFRDHSGALWVAYDRGLARAPRTNSPAPPSLQPPIAFAGVLAAFEDREGNMWFGTDTDGLSVLREQPFSTLTTADGLSGDFIRDVFEDHAGDLWIGTNRGGLDRLHDGSIASLQTLLHSAPSLSGSVVLALAETPPLKGASPASSALWIGTPDGLGRLLDGRLTLFTTADGLPDDFVRSLFADSDGSLWIGTRNGLAHYAHNVFTTYSRQDGLGADVIGAILRSRSGTLWVGTFGGLSRFDGAHGFVNYTQRNGLGGDAITALHEDREGTLWIAAHDAGLTRYANGSFLALHGPIPREIFSILEDGDDGANAALGNTQTSNSAQTVNSPQESREATPTLSSAPPANLWLGSSQGVVRVSLAALNDFADRKAASLPLTVFGTADGMRISECSSGGHPAAWRRRDGSLWFATLKGLAFVQPGTSSQNATPPLAAIEQVLVDDQPAPLDDDTLVIPPGHSRLTLHYAGLSFSAPQQVHFRYMLEGFDKDWVEAGTRRTAFYTNLPPGRYRFLVYAANNSGLWSAAPAAFQLTLDPYLYQTPWFYFLACLALLGLAWLLYRARVRSVQARYQAVLNERTRIAREIHDTLAQGYVGVSVQLELVSRLLRTPTPASLQSVQSQLERTKEFVRTSLEEARRSIWNLRSNATRIQPGPQPGKQPGADADTLPIRLASAIAAHANDEGPAVRLEVHGATRPLSRPLEDEFLRIAQEAIANAVRHARAQLVHVALTYDTDCLHLDISDDGTGFEMPPTGFTSTGHYGIQGMQERAHAAGARFHLRSQPGQGTIIEVALDLHDLTDLNNPGGLNPNPAARKETP